MSQKKYIDFGFCRQDSEHFFVVTIPASLAEDAEVTISEHFECHLVEGNTLFPYGVKGAHIHHKSFITRYKWSKIENEVKAEFNRRLLELGIKYGNWKKKGQVALNKIFGKELTLLMWAIEDADPALIYTAVRNWQGLAPEERWWLYTMTNASTGDAILGRNKGWRKAVRYALTENEISDNRLREHKSEIERLLFNIDEEAKKL